jgi:multimeric flavodoxin WrbA
MLSKLLEQVARRGVETDLIMLRELNIKGCDGCLACEIGGKERKGTCHIKDDMQRIYPKLLQADGWALGTPVYFELLSGMLKNFMDRTCPIWTKLEGKPVVGIAVAEEGIGKAIDNLRTYASICGMRWIGQVTALAKTPHQASKDKELEKRLDKLATKLVNALEA